MNTQVINMYNQYAKENQSLLKKALSSAPSEGEALIREDLETVMTNLLPRLSPILAMVDARYTVGKKHEFNRLTALPEPGGAMGEGANTNTSNSTWERAEVEKKIVRRKGSVTGFLAEATEGELEATAVEMESHLLAHAYDLDYYIVHGNAPSNTYEFSGWDFFIETNRTNNPTGGIVPTDLEFLDNMIDNNRDLNGGRHKNAILMSAKMLSKTSRLLTNVRNIQTDNKDGLTQIEINGGWRMMAYRGIPIIEHSGLRPKGTMTAVTATAFTTGGSLADATYYFSVAPITLDGEQTASAEASDTVSGGGGNGRVDLTFTAYPGAISYKVYFSSSLGLGAGIANHRLLRQTSAFTYSGTGEKTGSITTISITTATPGTDVPSGHQDDRPLTATGGIPSEVVMFVDLDPYQGLGKLPYTNKAGDKFKGLVTVEPLAKIDDRIDFLTKSYPAIADAFEKTSSIERGLRVA